MQSGPMASLRRPYHGFIERVAAAPEGSPPDLERPEARFPEPGKVLGERRGVLHQDGSVGPHPFPVPPAQQTSDGLARRLAQEIPERDVDAADRVRDGAAPAEPERVLVQLLADPLRLERVLSGEERLQHGQSAAHELLAREDAAETGKSLVGVDLDQGVHDVVGLELVAPPSFWGRAAQARGPNLSYLHPFPPSAAKRSSRAADSYPALRPSGPAFA